MSCKYIRIYLNSFLSYVRQLSSALGELKVQVKSLLAKRTNNTQNKVMQS